MKPPQYNDEVPVITLLAIFSIECYEKNTPIN